MKRAGVFIFIFLLLAIMSGCSSINEKMEKGQFYMAKTQINKTLAKDNVSDLIDFYEKIIDSHV